MSATQRQSCFDDNADDDGGDSDDGEVGTFTVTFQLAVLQPKNKKMKKSCRTNNGKRFIIIITVVIIIIIILIITIIIVVEYLFLEKMQELIPVVGIGVKLSL